MPALKGRGLRLWLSWMRHGQLGLLAAALVFVAGLPVVWIKGQSTYKAESVFQVSPNYQKNLSGDKELEFQSNSQYREFVNHLSRSTTRYDVLERALANLRAQGTEACLPPETPRKCIERFQRALFVLPMADTYMVRLGLSSTEKGLADKVVNAVMQTFLETVRDEQIYGADQRSDVLTERDRALRAELVAFEQQRSQLAGQLGLTTFTENISNPFDNLLAQAREKATQASIERSTAQAALAAFEAKREVPASGGRSVLEMRLQDNGLQALRNEVVRRSEELNRTVSGLESGHPAVSPARQENKAINERLQGQEKAFEQLALDNVRARLTATLLQTQQVERELRQQVELLQTQASGFATQFRDAIRLTADIRKREQELNEIRDRMNFMGTERDALGFARLITPALPATVPQGMGKVKLLAMLMVVCVGVALVLPVVVELLDRRVLEVADAEKAMGIPAAAWMIKVEDGVTALLAREQAKRFASTLMRNHARGAAGTFALTSVNVGGGATQLVIDLAHTLQMLGQRVLVVDANSLALSSALSSGAFADAPGLSDHLAGHAALDDVVMQQVHGEHSLSVVPFGRLRDGGLQRMDRLRAALAHWRADYDMVLVDVAPLLPSADAELVIDAVGQVFLVVEAHSVTKGDVVRARLQLTRQAPEAVGLIVNKLPMDNADASLRGQVVERITRGRHSAFMSTPALALQWQLVRLRLSRWLMAWGRRA